MEFLSDFFSRLFQSRKVTSEIQPPHAAPTKPTVGIEFYNENATSLTLWIELACISVELVPGMEYRIESDETEYRIEFGGSQVTLYLQYRFGPKVLQRPYSKDFRNAPPWELVVDSSAVA
jgi:hypothetical protein